MTENSPRTFDQEANTSIVPGVVEPVAAASALSIRSAFGTNAATTFHSSADTLAIPANPDTAQSPEFSLPKIARTVVSASEEN
jgi:hypothetical protein